MKMFHFKHTGTIIISHTFSPSWISPKFGCTKRVGVSHNHGFAQTLGNVAIEIVLDPLRLAPTAGHRDRISGTAVGR